MEARNAVLSNARMFWGGETRVHLVRIWRRDVVQLVDVSTYEQSEHVVVLVRDHDPRSSCPIHQLERLQSVAFGANRRRSRGQPAAPDGVTDRHGLIPDRFCRVCDPLVRRRRRGIAAAQPGAVDRHGSNKRHRALQRGVLGGRRDRGNMRCGREGGRQRRRVAMATRNTHALAGEARGVASQHPRVEKNGDGEGGVSAALGG